MASIANELEILWQLRSHTDPDKSSKNLRTWAGHSNKAELEYIQDGYNVRVVRHGESVNAWLNGEETPLELVPFPSRVLAVAHLPWDRFRFKVTDADDFYHYLGLRQATNLTTTGALETQVTESVIRASTQDFFHARLTPWMTLMGLDHRVSITIRLRPSAHRVLDAGSEAELESELHRLEEKRRGNARPPGYNLDVKEQISLIYAFVNFMLQKRNVSGRSHMLEIDFTPELSGWRRTHEEFILALNLARKLSLISQTSLRLSRDGAVFPFAQLSSGEQHILGTVSRILVAIRENSIIMIDEPEVSLHPSWQMRFIPMLMKTLAGVSCHLVMATHSHFMVSDVSEDGMALMISRVGSRIIEDFEGDVYGRSPENILYRAFGMGAVGNHYVETDLLNALQMVSGVQLLEVDRLATIYDRLKVLDAEDNQALSLILERIRTKLHEVG